MANITFEQDLDSARSDLTGNFHQHTDFNLNNLYHSYVKSGVWKCACSPSGAHFWTNTGGDSFQCIHCGEVTKFPTHISSAYLPSGIQYCRSQRTTSNKKSSKLNLTKVEQKPYNLHGQYHARQTT